MRYEEQPLLLPCADQWLLGLLSMPEQPADTAVLIVVGGPQYRVGSHRQFVQLARHLASGGFPVLRFDVRGMGDSPGGTPVSFEALDDDIAAAIDGLMQHGAGRIRRIVLWGLCDGASAALLYWQARRDPRVAGLVLLNPWVRSELSLARAQVKHYYLQRLREPAFWRKLLRGQVAAHAVSGLLRSAAKAWRGHGTAATAGAAQPFQQRMAQACAEFPGQQLLVLSGRDLTAQEFSEQAAMNALWARALQSPRLQCQRLPQADHTFSDAPARAALEALTLAWLQALPTGRPATQQAGHLQESTA
jgi:exosortase A-associated hydrolase 1